MSAEKKSSFLKIYFTAVAVFILLCIVFFIILAIMLNNYETGAEQKRVEESQAAESARIAAEESRIAAEKSRIAESERISSEIESERIRAEEDFRNRQDSVQDAVSAAVESIKRSARNLENTDPASFVAALTARLEREGASVLTALCDSGVSPYEPEGALESLFDGTEAKYTYEMKSGLSARISKGLIGFDITLEKTLKDGYIPEYSLVSAECSVSLRSFTVTVPEGASVKVNGKTVTDAPRTEKAAEAKDVPDVFDPPRIAVYELSGFINEPSAEASFDDTILKCVKTDGKFDFQRTASDKTEIYAEELAVRLVILTCDYTDFIAGVTTFSEFKTELYKGTAFYKALSNFDNRWYYTYDYIQNENAAVSNITVLSDKLVSARVTYDQVLYDAEGNRMRKVPMKMDVIIGCPKTPAVPDPEDIERSYESWLLIYVESV